MFLAGHVPHCLEPCPKRLPGAFKDRSGRWRGLTLACRTPGLASGRSPCRVSATNRALKPIRPPNPLQVLDAIRLGREPRIEFLQRAWVIRAAHGMSSLFFQHPSVIHLLPRRGKWIAHSQNSMEGWTRVGQTPWEAGQESARHRERNGFSTNRGRIGWPGAATPCPRCTTDCNSIEGRCLWGGVSC